MKTHPLRLRPFRLLFLGRTVSALGDAVVPAALALAVLRATGSTGSLALVLACALTPRLLLLPLGGVLADRLDARRVAILADLAHGWREVRSRDWFWSSLLGHGVWNGAAAVLTTLGPAVAVRRLGGEGVWVLMLQAGAVGMLAGSLLAARIRPRRPVLVANLGLASYAAPLALLAVAAPAPLVIAAYGVALTALGYLNPVWQTVVQGQFPPHVLARVTSYDWLVSLGAMPLGYALAPVAARAWGDSVPLLTAGALVLVACAGTAAVPGVRRLTSPSSSPGDEVTRRTVNA
ncbi:hypothetical protein AB0D32_20935 [Micromonospora sp. NPDC048170]|uniref:hypothetical protein n=1 Tax=Micromonospora sp. NPDC048170 TaxID=3154819 RepID=UPI0033E25538